MTHASSLRHGEQVKRGGAPPLFWLAALVAGLSGLLYASLRLQSLGPPMGDRHPSVGRSMAEIELLPLTGTTEPVNLESLKGKLSVVFVWGTWCPACVRELPHMAELERTYRDGGKVRIVAVSVEQGGESDLEVLRANTAAYLNERQIDMPTYADPEAAARSVLYRRAELGSFVVPTTLLLDQEGVIRGVWTGFKPGDELDLARAVKKLLR